MFEGSSSKEYYWELRQFSQSYSDCLRESQAPTKQFIYLFKKQIPDVIVRFQEPVEKIYSWAFTQFQVHQKLNDNPRVFHWKKVFIRYRGDMQLPFTQAFHQNLKEYIMEAIPQRTKALDLWLTANIDDVFLISTKSKQLNQKEVALIQIKSLTLNKYKNYFQTKSWKGKSWEQLLEIADRQGLKMNNSFGIHLQSTNNSSFSLDEIRERYFQEDYHQSSKKKKLSVQLRDLYQNNPEKKAIKKYSSD